MHMRRALLAIALLCFAAQAMAAPVVVTPGEASSYVYFPAGVTAQGGGGGGETVGQIAIFPKDPPDGWLACDGSTVQAADYPELVKYLANNPGDTSAQLPDYRGYFLRGWDSMGVRGSAEVDAGRSLDVVQDDMIKQASGATALAGPHTTSSAGEHSHQVIGYSGVQGTMNYHHIAASTNGWTGSHTGSAGAHVHTIPAHSHTFTIGTVADIETRPKNISVIYAIRAK